MICKDCAKNFWSVVFASYLHYKEQFLTKIMLISLHVGPILGTESNAILEIQLPALEKKI
jgi:hypothetical protein